MSETPHEILILTQYYPPEPGAPQIRLSAMAKELRRRGVEVRVITGMPNYPEGKVQLEYRGKLTASEERDGVQVRRTWLYPASGRGSFGRLLNYLSFTCTASVALAFARPADLIFVEAQPLTLAIPAWVAMRFRGTPYVYNTPDLQVEYADEDKWVGGRWLVKAARGLERVLMRDALSVTTVTHAFIEHFVEHRNVPVERMTFLPNGADTEVLRPMPRDEDYARELGVGDRKVFTYAGTHAHYQGLERIIEAADLLRDRKDIVIVMVGKGPVRDELKQAAARANLENVLFRESPFSEMHRLMSVSCASLVVLRDMEVAKKMRLSKAVPPLACGVPVIYAGHGETADMLESEGCGVKVEPERPELLAQAIVAMADDVTRRNAMGEAGRALVERELSWNQLVGDWLRQISDVMAGKAPLSEGSADVDYVG